MPFRLVPKPPTLDDLELLSVQIFSELCASWHVWEATAAKRMKIDPHCQRGNCCALKSTFQRCIDYVDIARRSQVGADLVFLHIIYQGCRALTLALARLSCHIGWNILLK